MLQILGSNQLIVIIIVHKEKKNYNKISMFNLPDASVNIILNRCPAYEHFTYSWNRKLCSL